MFQKLFAYLSTRGIVVMVLGFIVALGGLLVYMSTRFSGSWLPQVAFGVTIAGFVIYVLGRILVAQQRRKKQSYVNNNQ